MNIHPTTKNKGQYYCKSCNEWRNSDEWYYRKNKHKTRDGMCKSCRKAYRKDAKKLYTKNYYKENREHYLQLYKKWRENNIEKKLWYSAYHSAKRRNIMFDLKVEDIKVPVKCPVLSIPLDTHAEAGTGRGNDWVQNPYRPSVDRIDSKKGYTKNNIQIISWRANSLKKDATIDEIKKLYEHMRRTN